MEQVKPKYDREKAENLVYDDGWKVIPFWKPYGKGMGPHVFCQWYKCEFTDGGLTFNCTEQYMMYEKARLFGDLITAEKILNETDPDKMRKLGREIKNFDDKIWNKNKYSIVYVGNYLKFSQNEQLKQYILSTKRTVLVEASPYDAVWGVKMGAENEDINCPDQWQGQNLLGFALMHVRETLNCIN